MHHSQLDKTKKPLQKIEHIRNNIGTTYKNFIIQIEKCHNGSIPLLPCANKATRVIQRETNITQRHIKQHNMGEVD